MDTQAKRQRVTYSAEFNRASIRLVVTFLQSMYQTEEEKLGLGDRRFSGVRPTPNREEAAGGKLCRSLVTQPTARRLIVVFEATVADSLVSLHRTPQLKIPPSTLPLVGELGL